MNGSYLGETRDVYQTQYVVVAALFVCLFDFFFVFLGGGVMFVSSFFKLCSLNIHIKEMWRQSMPSLIIVACLEILFSFGETPTHFAKIASKCPLCQLHLLCNYTSIHHFCIVKITMEALLHKIVKLHLFSRP